MSQRCKVEKCAREPFARGLCGLHYQRDLKGQPQENPLWGAHHGEGNPNWRGGKSKHPLNEIYQDMIARCHRPTHPRYADYGGFRYVKSGETTFGGLWEM